MEALNPQGAEGGDLAGAGEMLGAGAGFDEVAILEEWVKRGAPDPRNGETAKAAKPKRTINLDEGRKFWAFQPVANPAAPAVKDSAWPKDPVDRFLLAKIEAKGLKPAGDADRAWACHRCAASRRLRASMAAAARRTAVSSMPRGSSRSA